MGYFPGLELRWQIGRQAFQKLVAVRTNRFQYNQEFHNIEPPFTQFVLPNKRRGLADALRELRLRKASIVSRLYQPYQQVFVGSGVNSSSQRNLAMNTARQLPPIWVYPQNGGDMII